MQHEPSRPSQLDAIALSHREQIILARLAVLAFGGVVLLDLVRRNM